MPLQPIYHNVRPYKKAYFQCFPIVNHNAATYKATIFKSHRGLRVETDSRFLQNELAYNSALWRREKEVLDALQTLKFFPVPTFYNPAVSFDLWEIKKLGVSKEWLDLQFSHLRYRKFDITGRFADHTPVIEEISAMDEESAIGLFYYKYRKYDVDVIMVREV